jgi:ubiquinone/menaquinone biosynthesis C-methylase UbiE
MKILDVGCGKNKRKGAIGIDIDPNSDADVIHDLNIFPWPFNDNEFDIILCFNVLEHIDNVPKAMEEIWRIGKNKGIVEISAPFPSSKFLYIDPTHKRAFVSKSFDFFVEGSEYYGKIHTKANFKLLKVEYKKDTNRWWDKFLLRLANKYKNHYESYFMYIYQIHAIYFKLEIKK